MYYLSTAEQLPASFTFSNKPTDPIPFVFQTKDYENKGSLILPFQEYFRIKYIQNDTLVTH